MWTLKPYGHRGMWMQNDGNICGRLLRMGQYMHEQIEEKTAYITEYMLFSYRKQFYKTFQAVKTKIHDMSR